MLHPNFQIKKSERICSRANDPNADLEIWNYRVDEHVCIHYFKKKKTFSSKKYTPKGSISLQKQPKKRSQKEVRNNREAKKTHKQHHNTQTLSEKSMSVTTDRPPGSFMFCRFCLLPCLFELHHVAHLGDFWNSKLNLHCLEVEVSRSKVTPPSSLTNVP